MVLADGTLVLGQQGQAVWTRSDGLASVRATMFMDLPSSQELAEERRRDATTALDALQNRLRFEFLNVKVCSCNSGPHMLLPTLACMIRPPLEPPEENLVGLDAHHGSCSFHFMLLADMTSLHATGCWTTQAGLQQASPEEQAFRAAYRSQHSARLSPARDSDGFRKLLLVGAIPVA